MLAGIPVVVMLAHDDMRKTFTSGNGVRVVRCPATDRALRSIVRTAAEEFHYAPARIETTRSASLVTARVKKRSARIRRADAMPQAEMFACTGTGSRKRRKR
jgi:gluconate kinase